MTNVTGRFELQDISPITFYHCVYNAVEWLFNVSNFDTFKLKYKYDKN